ncbi:hypothetical protein MPSEU_000818100 [Mayamaea pseudoterrestris]|nr:hypothetical protein MPSEU_000818100 [Mayamaea pseudoterrestris]
MKEASEWRMEVRGRRSHLPSRRASDNVRRPDVSATRLSLSSSDNAPMEPKSQMNRFISDFLQRENNIDSNATSDNDDTSASSSSSSSTITPTHLIAIPLDASHDLTLELESVQRAILYHAPILVHACIAPAKLRLPLLYVRSMSNTSSSSETTQRLQTLVQHVIDQHYLKLPSNGDAEQQQQQQFTAAAEPVLLEFAKLEIHGRSNNVLCTVAQSPPVVNDQVCGGDDDVDNLSSSSNGFKRLQNLILDLQETLQQAGYQSMPPFDGDAENTTNGETVFDLRVPFMRLPQNWEQLVKDNRKYALNITDNDEDDDCMFIPSELGGNGISPILWGKWMDDVFAKNVRMRQVAIYPRLQKQTLFAKEFTDSEDDLSSSYIDDDLTEDAFYLPERFVDLPMGDAAMTKREQELDEYQDERYNLEEEQMEKEWEAERKGERLDVPSPKDGDNDILLAKTRLRLEELFQQEALETTDIEVKNVEDATDATLRIAATEAINEDDSGALDDIIHNADGRPMRPEDPNAIDDWTRERIRNIVSSRAKPMADEELAKPKQKPAIETNTVFSKYKDGTLVPKPPVVREPVRQLPPFPSREHAIGFWRVVRSPTGFDPEEGDESRSDNLVLRVDGTISGGPILDQETRQKASGGTWKLFGTTVDDARLRIRLVIPPKKEQILVMDGRLEKVSFSSDLPLARGTFGIPALERLAEKSENELDDLLHCSGTVMMEDSVTGANKVEIGKFSITKINTPTDPKQFTITVPKLVGFQD